MRNLICFILILGGLSATAQRDLTPNKRKDAFGTRDLRNLSNYGLQFQLGPTYTMTRLNNVSDSTDPIADGFRGNYYHDPKGRLGIYGEIGMFHFPKKRSALSLKLKTVLVSYYDWGLGFKYFRGTENIHLDNVDAGGVTISEQDTAFHFGHGNVYGRFSIHKNIKISERFFLDNTLGFNFDYRLIQSSDEYNWQPMTSESAYYKPFYAQMHYGLGLGIRVKRGGYMVIGARTPFLGYQSTTPDMANSGSAESIFGNPAFRWYSSKYWPIMFHFKYMFLFEKKAKGCPPVDINEDDKERYRNGN